MRMITLITTGGTIEKTYDERSGSLENRGSIVQHMLSSLRLVDTRISTMELMSMDSLDMTEHDRHRIVDAVLLAGGASGHIDSADRSSGIIILHGTDTLCQTGDLLVEKVVNPRVPIVLTGAMRPYEMKRSDALQNLTESIFSTDVLSPGVYVVAHGRCLPFPGVQKDRQLGTFVRAGNQ